METRTDAARAAKSSVIAGALWLSLAAPLFAAGAFNELKGLAPETRQAEPPPQPRSQRRPWQPDFDRRYYASMDNGQLFDAGRRAVGRCVIVDNKDHYGVVSDEGPASRQVSQTTEDPAAAAAFLRNAVLTGQCDPLLYHTGSFDRNHWIAQTNNALFNAGRNGGIGACWIIDNRGWFGVLNSGGQISRSTNDSDAAGAYFRVALMEGQCDAYNPPPPQTSHWGYYLSLSDSQLFAKGVERQLGNCWIIDNHGWYGVIAFGRQISASTKEAWQAGGYLREKIVAGTCGSQP